MAKETYNERMESLQAYEELAGGSTKVDSVEYTYNALIKDTGKAILLEFKYYDDSVGWQGNAFEKLWVPLWMVICIDGRSKTVSLKKDNKGIREKVAKFSLLMRTQPARD